LILLICFWNADELVVVKKPPAFDTFILPS
jgi:hypothetical protein